jgi:ribosomal protein L22
MNVNFLPTGLYILQVATDKGFVTKKFVKNR